MNKYKMFLAAIASIISGNAVAQSLTADDVAITPNGTASLKIELTASQVAAAAQFDIKLPAGIKLDGASTRGALLNSDYTVDPTSLNGDSVRVFIYNKKQGEFASASGVLLELPIKADVAEGEYTGEISSVLVANKDAKPNGEYANSTFNISVGQATERGDVNGDGYVDSQDISDIVDYVIGTKEATADADLNGDGKVDGLDLAEEINIQFPTASSKAQFAPKTQAAVNNLSANGGTSVVLNLNNSSVYRVVQFDLTLPEGLEMGDIQLSSNASGMQSFSNKIGSNKWRVLVAGLDGQSVLGANAGSFISVNVEGTTFGDATIDNILFADTHANGTKFDNMVVKVFGGNATGINGINADTDAEAVKEVYSVGGAIRKGIQRGVNIVRDAAGKVTKVIKK